MLYKVHEYQNIGIKEYWIIDPIEEQITVMLLEEGSYNKAIFTGDNAVVSPTFPQFNLTVSHILSA